MAVHDGLFGAGHEIEWRKDAPEDLVLASKLQHAVAGLVLMHLRKTKTTRAAYGRLAQSTPSRIGALLRGDQPMRLDDIAAAARIVGFKLTRLVLPG